MSGLPPADSSDLLERCRQGDQAAFRQLFLLYSPTVLRLVARMLGRRADVEDTVQEVFLQVHRSLKDFRGDAKFSTWLHRVTVNVVLMARRAAQSRPVFAAAPPDDALHDDGLWPDEDAARRLRLRAFQRCIDRLPDKKRVVFILHELEGLPAAEIAEIVGAPVLTVRTRLFYARQELAELMRQEPTLCALAETEREAPAPSPGEPEGGIMKNQPSGGPGKGKR
jgi:RNA polymerase sigma-70 factor (ECF subfamily)